MSDYVDVPNRNKLNGAFRVSGGGNHDVEFKFMESTGEAYSDDIEGVMTQGQLANFIKASDGKNVHRTSPTVISIELDKTAGGTDTYTF